MNEYEKAIREIISQEKENATPDFYEIESTLERLNSLYYKFLKGEALHLTRYQFTYNMLEMRFGLSACETLLGMIDTSDPKDMFYNFTVKPFNSPYGGYMAA